VDRNELISAIRGGDPDAIIELVDRLIAVESGGGGSSLVYESGYYEQSGGATNIANNANALLSFDDYAGGDDVLDITNPIHPLVRKDGLFIVSVEAWPTGTITPGGSFTLALTLDFTGEAIEMRNTASTESGGICEISDSWVMAAGEQFRLYCYNFDGAEAHDFHINNATVSRIGPA
jgi:hypothetical protein